MASTAPWSRDRRRQKEKDDKLAAEADESMRNVMAKLGTWTSDRVAAGGTNSLGSPNFPLASPRYQYGGAGDGEVTWMKGVLERDNDPATGADTDHDMVSSPYMSRTAGRAPGIAAPETPNYNPSTPTPSGRGMERVSTPVMSNSKKGPEEEDVGTGLSRYSRSSFKTAATPSPNIHTPAPRSVIPRPLSSKRGTTPGRPRALSMEARQQVQTCQRYHDVLLQYLHSKRRWVERKELATSSALVTVDGNPETAVDGKVDNLSNEHKQIQVVFLKELCALCYDDHAVSVRDSEARERFPSREGNFWNLLAHLRSMGMGSLLWQGNANTQQIAELEQLQQSFDSNTTPLEILEALQQCSNDKQNNDLQSVSVIQRRYQLITWLEDCFRQQLPVENTVRANQTFDYQTNSELYRTQGLPETEKDSKLLRQALALIMSGRLEEAQNLMRANGLTWRAAVMGGGKPCGYEKTSSLDGLKSNAVGNPNRPLWQCMLWRQVEESTRNSTHEEMAISALLCNNVKASFSNPCLRTWEKALFAGVKAMVGRTEDILLYQQGAMAKNKFARTHLQNTADMTGMDEATLLRELANTPYPEMAMQEDDPFADATAAFMIGQIAVKAFLQGMQSTLSNGDPVALRFLTHLILYLDSTRVDSAGSSATASIQWELDQIRDPVVVKYIQSLANRELWNLLVLYASMLPSQTMLQYLPSLLVPVTNPNDRAVIVKQLRELKPDHELDVLRAVVKGQEKEILLSIQEAKDEEGDDMVGGRMEIMEDGQGDETMMKALLWFCILDDHAQEAIVYSNSLIRRFLLQEKLGAVFHFVENVRPTSLIEKIEDKMDTGEDEAMPDQDEMKERDSVLSEFYAYESYLKAEQSVAEWHRDMDQTPMASKSLRRLTTDSNMANWNDTERAIAINEDRRQLIDETRNLASGVVGAATAAKQALVDVMEHPSGWLWEAGIEENAGEISSSTDTPAGRSAEMLALRKQALPHVAMLHAQVCQETAGWMLSALQDIVVHGKVASVGAALALLDPSVGESSTAEDRANAIRQSPLSPTYWTTKALEMVETLASDTFSIPVNEQLLEQMANVNVSHLQYTADLDQNPSL